MIEAGEDAPRLDLAVFLLTGAKVSCRLVPSQARETWICSRVLYPAEPVNVCDRSHCKMLSTLSSVPCHGPMVGVEMGHLGALGSNPV